MKEKIELYKVRDLGDRINTVFRFVKQNGKQISRNFVYLLPIYIIGAIVTGFSQGSIYSGSYYGYSAYSMYSSPVYLVTLLIAIIIYLTSFVATLFVISFVTEYELSEDGTVDNSAAWSRAKQSFWGSFGGCLLVGLAVAIGFVFCIIPGIWLAVSFSLFISVYVAERNKDVSGGVTDCINESYNLIKQNWFGSFGYLFIVTVIVGAFYMVLSIPSMFNSIFIFISPASTNFMMVFSAFSTALYYIGALFVSILSSVAVTFLYFDLKERRDGVSIQKKIDDIGQ